MTEEDIHLQESLMLLLRASDRCLRTATILTHLRRRPHKGWRIRRVLTILRKEGRIALYKRKYWGLT